LIFMEKLEENIRICGGNREGLILAGSANVEIWELKGRTSGG